MAKKTYDSNSISVFPAGYQMVLPDGYRIDTEYDDDYNPVYHLRGDFHINDDGEEEFTFSGGFITLNVNIEDRESLIKKENFNGQIPPGYIIEQAADGVMENLQNQFGPGTRLNMYNSFPASTIMKFYKPVSLFGATIETYFMFLWVEVNENTIFGFNTVYQDSSSGNGDFFKHFLRVIKSVRVNGEAIDTGKLTPKKLEQALDMDLDTEDVEALDLGLSIGVNFKYGDEESQYMINSDGSITGPDGEEVPPYEEEDEEEEENPFLGFFSALNEMNGPKISEEDSRKVIVDNKWSFRLPDGLDLLFNEQHVDIIGSDTTADYVVKGLNYNGRCFFDFDLHERYADGISKDVDVLGCRYDNDVISGNAQQKIIKDDDDLYVDLLNKSVFFFNSMVLIRVRGEDIRPWDFSASLKSTDEEMTSRWDEVKVLINELAESITLLDSAKKSAKKKKVKKVDGSSDPDFIIQNGVLRKYIGNKRNIVIPDGVTELADSVFSGFSNIKTVVVPEGVKIIGRRCFENCTHLKKCYLPDSLEELGGYAFVDCHELQEVYLSDKIKSLGDSAFSECFALKDVRLPKKIKEIDAFTFKNCDKFSHIVIPEGVKSIGVSSFVSCDDLEYLFIPASVTDITIDFMDNHPFAGSEKMTIYTPSGSAAQKFAEEHGIPYQNASKGKVTADNTGASTKSAGSQSGNTGSGNGNNGFTYATPDESLYPHYDSKSVSGSTTFFGMKIERRSSGTDYQFFQLPEDLGDDASEDLKKAVSQLSDRGAAAYKLADRAAKMRNVFHVSPEIYNVRDDRESELREGLMQKAYMMSAIRSFAWTVSNYCEDKGLKPSDLSLAELKSIISFVAEREWLNYDGNSYCKSLCGTSDIHVYYIPDNTSKSAKAILTPAGSLDGLRKDLGYIHPAIEKIYEDVKKNRDYNELPEGNEVDVLYSWCALAYAARAPFFTEDGPMFYFYSQEETEEERQQKEEERRRQAIAERAEFSKQFLKTYGKYIEKNPRIEFRDKKFVFTGLKARRYTIDDDTDYAKLIENKGGLTRSKVSGVTDYLVVDPAGAGDSKISDAIENQKNGKPIKIIHMNDFRKALGLPPDEVAFAKQTSVTKNTAPAGAAKAAAASVSSSTGLTAEQQRQKEDLTRQIEDLKSQAAFYSAQDLSAEDRQTLAETKKGIEDLEKQMDGMSAAQDKLADHLRQKEEQERKREEERQRKVAEAKAAGKGEVDEAKMYVLLLSEAKAKIPSRTQKELYEAYKDDFPAYNQKELGSLKKEVQAKMKDKETCKRYADIFRSRSVKERFELVTGCYFSYDLFADYSLRAEDAIVKTAEWFSVDEMPEVRKLMDDMLDRNRKSADGGLDPIETKWKKYWSAKEFLKILIKDYDPEEKRADCRMFQAEIEANDDHRKLLVEAVLATKGILQLSTPVMNFFPYYWGTTYEEIWEEARRNEISDNCTYMIEPDQIAREAIRIIKRQFPNVKGIQGSWSATITNKAKAFTSFLSDLYNTSGKQCSAADIKNKLKESYNDEFELAEGKEKLFETAKGENLITLADLLKENTDVREMYNSIPDVLASDIKKVREEKELEANEKKYAEAVELASHDGMRDLTKAEMLLGELGSFKDSASLLKQVSVAAESLKSAQYNEAVSLFKEGTEESVNSAIDKLDELGLYNDANVLVNEYKEYLRKEREYQSAVEGTNSNDLLNLSIAKLKLERLSGFKNADGLLIECSEKLESIKAGMYDEALSLAEKQTEESITEARTIMNRLKPYRDAEKKIEELNELLSSELIYKSATSALSDTESKPEVFKTAMEKFASIEGYKDSAEQKEECEKQYETCCKYYYVKARKAESIPNTASQREAISLYRDILDYDDSKDRIGICQKNMDTITEILGLERELCNDKDAIEKQAGKLGKKERKYRETKINEKAKALAEKKQQFASEIGADTSEVSDEGLSEKDLSQIYEPIDEKTREESDAIAVQYKKKGRKKWLIIGAILAVIAIAAIAVLPDLLKPDLLKHGEMVDASIHGMEYEVPENWEPHYPLTSTMSKQYLTLEQNGKIVASIMIEYCGDTDLEGTAGYNEAVSGHYASKQALTDIPEAQGYYDMIMADESAFEITIYYVEGSVKNGQELLSAICGTFNTAAYTNPRKLKDVKINYTGSTTAETVIDGDNTHILVDGIYDTGISTGQKKVDNWKLKEPVTLEAGKTSKLTIIVDGKEYTTSIKCSTESKDVEKTDSEEESDSSGGSINGTLPSRP